MKSSCVEDGLPLPAALEVHKVDKRTFYRKRPIAELQILDPAEYDKIMDRLSRASNASRNISQEKLSTACKDALAKPALIAKRRLASSKGQLL